MPGLGVVPQEYLGNLALGGNLSFQGKGDCPHRVVRLSVQLGDGRLQDGGRRGCGRGHHRCGRAGHRPGRLPKESRQQVRYLPEKQKGCNCQDENDNCKREKTPSRRSYLLLS